MHASLRSLLLLASFAPATVAAPKLDIPKATWEPIFFASINAFSKKVNWPPLRDMDLGADAMEVRVWTGFGLMGIQGKRIRRVGQKWTGYLAVDGSGEKELSYNHEFPLGPEWDAEWKRIREIGVWNLPDSSTLPDEAGVFDGISYVIEINDGAHYRTYMYSNPSFQKWPEAKVAMKIVGAISLELSRADSEKMAAEMEGAGKGPSGKQNARP